MSILRNIAPDTARKTAAELRALGVTLPKDVRDLLEQLDDLDGRRPVALTQADLEAVYIGGGDDAAVLDMAVALTTQGARLNAWTEARVKVGQAAVSAFTANGDNLAANLAKLAAPLIEKMHDAGKLDTLDTTALIRASRNAEAEIAARVDIVAADLDHLYRLRDKITKGAEYGAGGIDCRRWKDPRPAAEADRLRTPTTNATDAFLRGIKAGGELWFPLPAEAVAAARPIVEDERHKAEADRQTNRDRSFVAFAG